MGCLLAPSRTTTPLSGVVGRGGGVRTPPPLVGGGYGNPVDGQRRAYMHACIAVRPSMRWCPLGLSPSHPFHARLRRLCQHSVSRRRAAWARLCWASSRPTTGSTSCGASNCSRHWTPSSLSRSGTSPSASPSPLCPSPASMPCRDRCRLMRRRDALWAADTHVRLSCLRACLPAVFVACRAHTCVPAVCPHPGVCSVKYLRR